MATISKATVLSVEEHGPEIREYNLQPEKNYYFEAGSFLLLTLERKDDYTRWPDSRNFSIASAYSENGTIRLIIRKVGAYTEKIFQELIPGASCVLKYAFGDFLLPFFDKSGDICCIAGGTGIAPILSFAEQMQKQGQQSRLQVFYSFKNKEEQPGLDILKAIVSEPNLHLFCTREEFQGIPNRRIVWSDIVNSGFDFQTAHFYICGGEEFTKYFVGNLKTVQAENVYTDEW